MSTPLRYVFPALVVATLAAWPLWVRAQVPDSARALWHEGEFFYYETPPVVVKKVRPIYPAFARQAEIRGKVTLHVLVGTNGRVRHLRVFRGVTGLDSAAAECVRQWLFRPALADKKPVAVWFEVPISFPVDACPPNVLEGARASVIAQVGKNFFEHYLTLDSAACAFPSVHGTATPRWALAYTLRMPGKPWVKGRIRVDVDTMGVLLPGRPIEGIGDCAHYPGDCAFSVDEVTARDSAKKAGLAPGLAPWKIDFVWVALPRPCYAWVVQNTLRGSRENGEGDLVIIDANTGRPLVTEHWRSKPEYAPGSARPDTAAAGAH